MPIAQKMNTAVLDKWNIPSPMPKRPEKRKRGVDQKTEQKLNGRVIDKWIVMTIQPGDEYSKLWIFPSKEKRDEFTQEINEKFGDDGVRAFAGTRGTDGEDIFEADCKDCPQCRAAAKKDAKKKAMEKSTEKKKGKK